MTVINRMPVLSVVLEHFWLCLLVLYPALVLLMRRRQSLHDVIASFRKGTCAPGPDGQVRFLNNQNVNPRGLAVCIPTGTAATPTILNLHQKNYAPVRPEGPYRRVHHSSTICYEANP
jgi:hypothetical protein